jgi:hypothetical protein
MVIVAFSQNVEVRPAETLPFEVLEFIDCAVGWTIAPLQRQSGCDSGEAVFESGGEGCRAFETCCRARLRARIAKCFAYATHRAG